MVKISIDDKFGESFWIEEKSHRYRLDRIDDEEKFMKLQPSEEDTINDIFFLDPFDRYISQDLESNKCSTFKCHVTSKIKRCKHGMVDFSLPQFCHMCFDYSNTHKKI